MNEKTMHILNELLPYFLIIVVVVLIRTFVATPVYVKGDSMLPTLKNKELLLLNKYQKKYKRYDIVVVDYNDEKLIKRVMGMPGEFVEYRDGKYYINGKKIDDKFAGKTGDFDLNYIDLNMKKIPEGKYFVVGDNRGNSIDSRTIGLVDKKDIEGTVTLSILPFKKIEVFNK